MPTRETLRDPMIDVPFCEVMEVRDGKIRRARLYLHSATLMRQLGVVPEVATA